MINYPVRDQSFKTCFGKEIVCSLRDGTCDFNAIQSVLVNDEYNLKSFLFGVGDVIINIGAYIGGFSLLLASLDKKLKIYSYEPLPENFDLLQKNILRNGFTNIFPFLLAVGGREGKMKIYYGDDDTETGKVHHFLGSSPNMPQKGFCEADCTTLEKIFLDNKIDRCRLLKLDCEGPEFDILRACPPEILKKIDWIIGEHHLNPRREIFEATKGLFLDMPCAYQSDGIFGHFKFKNIKL